MFVWSNKSMEIDHKRLLEEQEEQLDEAISFFSNANKKERELIVVRYFLENLGITFTEEELESVTNEPPDIKFKEANFEIKELPDSNRRRHEEYKRAKEKCRVANKISDMFEFYTPENLTFQEIVNKLIAFIIELEREHTYDVTVKNNLDLLIYFNQIGYHFTGDFSFDLPNDISEYGWRSILVTKSDLSCVLFSSDRAPSFLKEITGQVFSNVMK
jgi:hypothetical protein